ncbi:MAG: HNH endonuclease [Candidatus Electryonea clarkiae]|nr:HNH endonuclease [Candidatus Electryonea clarkiae]MDP8286783.1 HNH endonuclease [Candidatus Electryonea clarkiae]
MTDKVEVLQHVLKKLKSDNHSAAMRALEKYYPFKPQLRVKRSWTQLQSLKLFVRDGFIDRYSGDRLLFPGALKAIALLLPEQFPFHRNWKMDESHIAFWELFPTVDHIEPIARGGKDDEENWATTSMLRNQAKAQWTLDELGWVFHPVGNLKEWDGLMQLTLELAKQTPTLIEDNYFRKWLNTAKKISANTY